MVTSLSNSDISPKTIRSSVDQTEKVGACVGTALHKRTVKEASSSSQSGVTGGGLVESQ